MVIGHGEGFVLQAGGQIERPISYGRETRRVRMVMSQGEGFTLAV